jgi:Ser/Thr protein kinase RdoA (MazF antagonist)
VTGPEHPGRRLADEVPTLPAGIVHDLNNLLGGMLANLHLAMADLPAGHPAQARVESVNRAALEARALLRRPAADRRPRPSER